VRAPTHAGQFLAFLAAQLTGMGVYLFVVWPMTGFGTFSGASGPSPHAGLSALIVFVGAAPVLYVLAHDTKALRQGRRLIGHIAAGSIGWFIAALIAFGFYFHAALLAVVGNAVLLAIFGALSGAAYWLVTILPRPPSMR
jgi:hypothetical protein